MVSENILLFYFLSTFFGLTTYQGPNSIKHFLSKTAKLESLEQYWSVCKSMIYMSNLFTVMFSPVNGSLACVQVLS